MQSWTQHFIFWNLPPLASTKSEICRPVTLTPQQNPDFKMASLESVFAHCWNVKSESRFRTGFRHLDTTGRFRKVARRTKTDFCMDQICFGFCCRFYQTSAFCLLAESALGVFRNLHSGLFGICILLWLCEILEICSRVSAGCQRFSADSLGWNQMQAVSSDAIRCNAANVGSFEKLSLGPRSDFGIQNLESAI